MTFGQKRQKKTAECPGHRYVHLPLPAERFAQVGTMIRTSTAPRLAWRPWHQDDVTNHLQAGLSWLVHSGTSPAAATSVVIHKLNWSQILLSWCDIRTRLNLFEEALEMNRVDDCNNLDVFYFHPQNRQIETSTNMEEQKLSNGNDEGYICFTAAPLWHGSLHSFLLLWTFQTPPGGRNVPASEEWCFQKSSVHRREQKHTNHLYTSGAILFVISNNRRWSNKGGGANNGVEQRTGAGQTRRGQGRSKSQGAEQTRGGENHNGRANGRGWSQHQGWVRVNLDGLVV